MDCLFSQNRTSQIDVLEEDLQQEVLERLLWERSKPCYVENGEEKHHHIYWATNDFSTKGEGYTFFDEMQIECFIRDNRFLLQPRAAKAKEEQNKRTKDKGEVFTPSWLCNDMNNMADDSWSGETNWFNVVDMQNHTWQPTEGKIKFPTNNGKDWQSYIKDTRMEITCGEAPFLVSRYDSITGEYFDNLNQRIGFLDRKLRVVGEQVETKEDWIKWAKMAVKCTYGYEWQGDNLLLARENILSTFVDYYEDFCQRVLHEEQPVLPSDVLITVAEIISWNIIQMDGLKFVLPMTCHDEEEEKVETDLLGAMFGEEKKKKLIPCRGCAKKEPHHHNGIYAKLAGWEVDSDVPNEIVEFHTLLKSEIHV